MAGLLTRKRTVRSAYWGMSESNHRTCKCGAVYDRSEHIVEGREISSFECAVCGATIENWNSAWVPRYRFIACPARTPNDTKSIVDIATGQKPDRDPTPEEQGKDPAAAELGASSHLPSSR
jgi:hypothetical protein